MIENNKKIVDKIIKKYFKIEGIVMPKENYEILYNVDFKQKELKILVYTNLRRLNIYIIFNSEILNSELTTREFNKYFKEGHENYKLKKKKHILNMNEDYVEKIKEKIKEYQEELSEVMIRQDELKNEISDLEWAK